MTAVWPNIKCLVHMNSTSALYTSIRTHGRTRADRHTHTQSGWISEIAAAHTLAHVVHTRAPLRCGWAFLSVKTQSYICFTNVYEGICFLSVHFYEHARKLSAHTRAHMQRSLAHPWAGWWRVWGWFALVPQTIIHTQTCILVCMCVCVYVYMFFFVCFSGYTW